MTYAASATLETLENDHESRTLWWAVALMLLTAVHHSYGAVIYHTPWRHHAAIVAVVTVLLLIGLLRTHRSLARKPANIAFWMFVIVTLLIPFAVIGLFEGGYNHGLKDVLYFTTANRNLMERLFPPPTYEMPNDAFFEISGVLQFPLGLVTGWDLFKTIRAHVRR